MWFARVPAGVATGFVSVFSAACSLFGSVCALAAPPAVPVEGAPVSELVIATVNNRQMVDMQKLSKSFERANPDVRLKWVVLEESTLRQRVSADIAAQGGQFDVITIGMYETPIWGKKGWLREIQTDAAYNLKDVLPTVRAGLSVGKALYAAPFYGESSMTMYRTDLFAKAGISMANRPSWEQIRQAAQKLHDPQNGIYGICLRGKPGWGDNMAVLSTLVNTFGGQWFDMQWRPQINTPPWQEAISFYVDLLKNYGPPNAVNNSFNENLALFAQGHCAIWVDATAAGTSLVDERFSKVTDKTGFALAPVAKTTQGASWLWAWALAVPVSSRQPEPAQRFIRWATSEAYLSLVGQQLGWAALPSGTRYSTYRRPEFRQVARFAMIEAVSIAMADPNSATLPPSPYTGVQFAAIAEFQSIGQLTGEHISQALAGRLSVTQALEQAQIQAEQQMRQAGYGR